MIVQQPSKTPRGNRALKKREPQVHENVKSAMFIRGRKTSEVVMAVMDDLFALKKPAAIKYSHKKSNDVKPFEDTASLEFFSSKSDASLFVLGTHSKKRPHNLTIGRLFNYHILDLLELGIYDYKPIEDFDNSSVPMIGSKPCFSVIGSEFHNDEKYSLAANLIIDFFRGPIVDHINLKGLEHVISLSVSGNGNLQFRHYAIIMKKSGTRVPVVELKEIGPSIDFVWRRHQFGAEDLRKETFFIPKILTPKKQKNVTRNKFQDKVGTVHVSGQELTSIHNKVKKPKALRKRKSILFEDETQPVLVPPKRRKSK